MSIQGMNRKSTIVALLGIAAGLVLVPQAYAQRTCGSRASDYIETGKCSAWTIEGKNRSVYYLRFTEDKCVTVKPRSGSAVKASRGVIDLFRVYVNQDDPVGGCSARDSSRHSEAIVFQNPQCDAGDPVTPTRVIKSDASIHEFDTNDKEVYSEDAVATRTSTPYEEQPTIDVNGKTVRPVACTAAYPGP